MSVIRVAKTKDYTVMSNHHLKNRDLSLKAKGLMSWMLSCPDDWDFTVSGIVSCMKEGKDAIASTLTELEKAGYLIKTNSRGKDGKFQVDFVLHEEPKTIVVTRKNSSPERKTRHGKTATENPQQINTKRENTEKENALSEKERASRRRALSYSQRKTLRDILSDPDNETVSRALERFMEYCKDQGYRYRVTDLEKWAQVLRDNSSTSEEAMALVLDCIERGWRKIAPLTWEKEDPGNYEPDLEGVALRNRYDYEEKAVRVF